MDRQHNTLPGNAPTATPTNPGKDKHRQPAQGTGAHPPKKGLTSLNLRGFTGDEGAGGSVPLVTEGGEAKPDVKASATPKWGRDPVLPRRREAPGTQ